MDVSANAMRGMMNRNGTPRGNDSRAKFPRNPIGPQRMKAAAPQTITPETRFWVDAGIAPSGRVMPMGEAGFRALKT